MGKTLLLAMLLLTFAQNIYAQQIPDLSKYKTAHQKLEALAYLCDTLNNQEDYAREKVVSRYALSMIPANDYYYLSLFNFNLGVAYEYDGGDDSSLYFHEKSLDFARKAKSPRRIKEALGRLLYIYTNTGGYTAQSKATFKEILGIVDTTRSEREKVGLYVTIANYYSIQGQYENQIKYLLASIEVTKKLIATGKIKDRELVVADIMNLAELYISLNQPDKGISYSLEARGYIVTNKTFLSHHYKDMTDAYLSMSKPEKARVYYDSLTNMAKNDYARGYGNKISVDLSFADFYLQHNKPDSAQIYMTQANQLASKWAGTNLMSQVTYMSGEVFMAQKQYEKALPLLKASETFCEGWDRQIYVSLLQSLARCYAATGKWQQAYEYYEKYAPLRDSLYVEASKKSIADAEALYQNKEKQAQIEIKNLQIDEAKKQRLWLISGVSFLAISLALLAIIYRNKRKNAEILDAKNQEMAQLIHELEEANRTKAKLFSIISHDLRSPINQVYQFLKLQQLNPQLLSEAQKAELNEKIQTATGSLLETMEDLLLWSKTQINQFKADIQPVEVARVTEQCIKLLQLNLVAKQISIIHDVPANVVVETDPYYLQAIVRNLLQNAIKASSEQSQIRLELTEKADQRALAIENPGPAFSQEAYENILAQKDSNQGMNGLGLRLVDELSEKTGLKIRFENPAKDVTRALVIF
ncbi:tetratricopeptide repeat-containing sensor histidine kinase [Dyadobacter luticola]|uniref:histidine kinase n=1 Tax=Dyadobacter luticola TaxID=1979387 RepID=A0A5R9L0U6_9BACT|nr:ATP-binding protein [Dyadobacter luticola]TLV02143.1 GHKL domain-containing protein [Dyadobacter luticola]